MASNDRLQRTALRAAAGPQRSTGERTIASTRVEASNVFAGVGVLLLVSASVSPADWYPSVQLFIGLAFIAISHVLTPCQDQVTRWWNARLSQIWRRKDASESRPSL